MATEWFLYYGLKIGLPYQDTLDIAFGRLSDLIAIEKIVNEGFMVKKSLEQEEDEFFALLTWR